MKKEYEEKQKLKREKRKEKQKDKDKGQNGEGETKKSEEEQDKDDEMKKDEKINELSQSKDQAQIDLGPRIFTLQKYVPQNGLRFELAHACPIIYIADRNLTRNFYQMRLDRIRNAELAKRNRERLNNPSNFPSPPSNLP